MRAITAVLLAVCTLAIACGRAAEVQMPVPASEGSGASVPGSAPIESFRDCADCPVMVVIPAGHFMMGSDPAEGEQEGVLGLAARERPRHMVTVAAFAMGRTEVTRGLYARFAAQNAWMEKGRECGVPATTPIGPPPSGMSPRVGGAGPGSGAGMYEEPPVDPNAPTVKNWHNPGFAQSDSEPAVCVSYNDAKAFVAWLSIETGKRYRLPTDAEWEYAARGGTVTSRYWGNDSKAVCKNAAVASFSYAQAVGASQRMRDELLCNSDRAYTLSVGSLSANPFGLYDVLGNVAEVVEGCAHGDYSGAPTDGSAWVEGECKLRNWRGGSYSSQVWLARAAAKIQQTASYRNPDFGLRVVRDLK